MNTELIKRFKRYITDFGVNIVASLLVTMTTQLAVYPFIARTLSSSNYGNVLFLMGILNTVIATLGSSLNNTRLLMRKDYDNKSDSDFTILGLIFAATSVMVCAVLFLLIDYNIGLVNKVLIVLYTMTGVIREYAIVKFRITLQFRQILLNNVLMCVGAIIGILLFSGSIWILPFCLSNVVSCIYIFRKQLFIKHHRIQKSILFNEAARKTLQFVLVFLLSNLVAYIDRFVILPLLGDSFVSVYSTASFFGKSLGLFATPISAVLLSYYVQDGTNLNRRVFWNTWIIVFCAGLLFYIVSVTIGEYLTGILYPTLIEDASTYIPLASLAGVLYTCSSLINPFIIKKAPICVQLISCSIYGVVYIGMSLVLAKQAALFGLCYAAIFANCARIVYQLCIGTKYSKT